MPLKIIKKKWQSLKDFAKFNLTIKKPMMQTQEWLKMTLQR